MESPGKQFEQLVTNSSYAIAEKIVDMHYLQKPDIWNAFGPEGRRISVRDAMYHLPYLTEAVVMNEPRIFSDYIDWVKMLFTSIQLPEDTMADTLQNMKYVLREMLPEALHPVFEPHIEAGLLKMGEKTQTSTSFIDPDTELGRLAKSYMMHLIKGDRRAASELIMSAVDNGISVKEVYLEVFQKTLHEIGRLWLSNQISVGTEHFCTAATQSIMSQLYPKIFSGNHNGLSMVAACVGNELHEIGIRMVADFFEMDGWDTYYLGANTPVSAILSAIEKNQADILGLSASMPYHGGLMKETIDKVKNSTVGKDVRIIIGGNAVNKVKDRWQWFNADGYAPDAQQAIRLAEQLIA